MREGIKGRGNQILEIGTIIIIAATPLTSKEKSLMTFYEGTNNDRKYNDHKAGIDNYSARDKN